MMQNINTVKERPILFSGPMVRAILSGLKTQTRRVVKPQPPYEGIRLNGPESYHPAVAKNGFLTPGEPVFGIYDDEGEYGCVCPYGSPGDRLWVRETWTHTGVAVWTIEEARRASGNGKVLYRATDKEPCPNCWWPSIHMPREFSRINLEVTGVRVERLQDISEADAKAEGVEILGRHLGRSVYRNYQQSDIQFRDITRRVSCNMAYESYRTLWESINGPESWVANPWVWVVEFRRI